jgi:F-type H+-transporting ATPase subunit gamma
MATLKTLRTRIKSVKNTQQITKTMKMVAAAKVRRARAAVDGARPYAARLSQILADLTANPGSASGAGAVMLTGRPTVKTVRIIACGTDRGLCGSLNANLVKAATQLVRQQQALGRTVQLVGVGRKMRDAFKQSFPTLLVGSHTDMGRNVDVAHAQTVANEAREAFESGNVDEVHLVFSACLSMLTQTPTVKRLLPFNGEAKTVAVEDSTPRAVASYEPSADAVLEKLLPLNLTQQVFAALLETNASEQAARMTAMDSATRNAGEMIKKLSIQYNRSRQAAITKELIEIISGAEAL